MTPQEEQKYRRVRMAVDKQKLRLRDELRRRWPSPEALLRQLGIDQKLAEDLTSVAEMARAEKERSMTHEQMAQHGHGGDRESEFDMEPLRKHLATRFGEDEIEVALDLVRKGMRGARDDEDGPEQRQERLEHAEREVSPMHKRDDMRARETEHRNSVQSEDKFPHRSRGYLPGNRFAHDAEIAALAGRIGTSMSGYGGRERLTGPNNIALDSVEQNAKFLERLARLEAGR